MCSSDLEGGPGNTPSPGSEYDVNTYVWGTNLRHTTIDDNSTVQEILLTGINNSQDGITNYIVIS